jgi:hypothetical protein
VHHDRLITGVAAALAGSAVLVAVVAVVTGAFAVLAVSAALGASAYFMYYQSSGRLAARVYRSVERQAATNSGRGAGRGRDTRRRRQQERGGFGAGPREDWVPPRDGASGRRRRQRQRDAGTGGTRQQTAQPDDGPSTAEAYRTLGVERGADEATIKRAYREKVKDVHPDAEGGDEETFKRVNRAYEQLT